MYIVYTQAVISALSMHWPSFFAPLMAFGGRFDVTGLIPADQYD
jgi:hypothetical protein